MIVTPLRVILFLAAALVAAAGTAYVAGAFDSYLDRAPAVAADPEQQGAAGKAERLAEGAAPGGEEAQSAAPADDAEDDAAAAEDVPAPEVATDEAADGGTPAADEQASADETPAGVVVPVFDVVRVEPDGSMVIAGHAAPQSSVEVVAGATIIGTAKSGPRGDFAVVLDEPLDPGDYQIVLRATAPDDVVATSKETAVVSVPDSEDGEVLALVEEPGKPSRLITVPKGKPAESADAAPTPAPTAQDEAGQNGGSPERAARTAIAEPVLRDDATQAQEPEGMADPGQGAAGAPAAGSGADIGETAAKVSIEAVEIDGRQVFVAGAGVPGKRVRVYANDILLGDSIASPTGRFLVEATRDLPVGDYIVRADLLSDDGSEVVARAAVPFARQAAEKMAAVAPGVRDDAGGAGTANGENAEPSPHSAGQAAGAKAEAMGADGSVVLPDLHSGLAANAPVVTEPRLENVDGAVIIRRGDTLWHISRRVYGRGIRYSTIYLANQDQIRDPDLIWPGQIFTVPEKTDEGETADMSAIGDQAVPVPPASTARN